MKEELDEAKHKSEYLNKEKETLSERLKAEEAAREKVTKKTIRLVGWYFNWSRVALKQGLFQQILQLESDLKRASVQRDEVDNVLTSVTLQKDALADEVGHVRKEMDEIRAHLDRVCEENAQLNKNR